MDENQRIWTVDSAIDPGAMDDDTRKKIIKKLLGELGVTDLKLAENYTCEFNKLASEVQDKQVKITDKERQKYAAAREAAFQVRSNQRNGLPEQYMYHPDIQLTEYTKLLIVAHAQTGLVCYMLDNSANSNKIAYTTEVKQKDFKRIKEILSDLHIFFENLDGFLLACPENVQNAIDHAKNPRYLQNLTASGLTYLEPSDHNQMVFKIVQVGNEEQRLWPNQDNKNAFIKRQKDAFKHFQNLVNLAKPRQYKIFLHQLTSSGTQVTYGNTKSVFLNIWSQMNTNTANEQLTGYRFNQQNKTQQSEKGNFEFFHHLYPAQEGSVFTVVLPPENVPAMIGRNDAPVERTFLITPDGYHFRLDFSPQDFIAALQTGNPITITATLMPDGMQRFFKIAQNSGTTPDATPG